MLVRKNRYGDSYHWERLADEKYLFRMEGNSLDYCRVGGELVADGSTFTSIAFFDPSGGPFTQVGDIIEPELNEFKKISKIRGFGDTYLVETIPPLKSV